MNAGEATTAEAQIIFLHGASSAGKSTLARALQNEINTPFWHISFDHLRDSGMLPWARFKNGDFPWRASRANVFNGYHRSLAAYCAAGNNLIVEHILDTKGWLDDLVGLLEPYNVLFVGIHCDLEELNRRELARGDRPIGSAEQDFNTIHDGMSYDIEVSRDEGLDVQVQRILAAWRAPQRVSVFTKGKV